MGVRDESSNWQFGTRQGKCLRPPVMRASAYQADGLFRIRLNLELFGELLRELPIKRQVPQPVVQDPTGGSGSVFKYRHRTDRRVDDCGSESAL